MLIGYTPINSAVSGIAITGAAWLTPDGGAGCYDGKPARKARADGTPAITLTYASAFKPRIIAVLGLAGDVAEGVSIVATTGSGGALGGNAGTATVRRFADGTLGTWIVTDGSVSTSTVKIAIGATGQIDIGEIVALPAVEVLIDRSWAFDAPGSSTRMYRGRSSQVSGVPGTDYRRLTASLDPSPVDQVRGGGLANGMDWHQLRAAFSGSARVAAIPRWKTTAGALDSDELNATALYGIVGSQGAITHQGGDQYSWSLGFEEVPAI